MNLNIFLERIDYDGKVPLADFLILIKLKSTFEVLSSFSSLDLTLFMPRQSENELKRKFSI
jgi:hypothetical protein